MLNILQLRGPSIGPSWEESDLIGTASSRWIWPNSRWLHSFWISWLPKFYSPIPSAKMSRMRRPGRGTGIWVRPYCQLWLNVPLFPARLRLITGRLLVYRSCSRGRHSWGTESYCCCLFQLGSLRKSSFPAASRLFSGRTFAPSAGQCHCGVFAWESSGRKFCPNCTNLQPNCPFFPQGW